MIKQWDEEVVKQAIKDWLGRGKFTYRLSYDSHDPDRFFAGKLFKDAWDEKTAAFLLRQMEECGEEGLLDWLGVLPIEEFRKNGFNYVISKRDYAKKASVKEKALCRALIKNGFPTSAIMEVLGTPLEYELNIVGSLKSNVDLASYNYDTGEFFLIEVKKVDSTETLLRAVTEIATYYFSIRKIPDYAQKLIDGINANISWKGYQQVFGNRPLIPADKPITVKPAVLVPEGSLAAGEYRGKEHPSVVRLMEKLGIVFVSFPDNTPIE